jgi:N-alpha-acetyltransferase 30
MSETPVNDIEFTLFKDETQLDDIIKLIQNDLSEPYSIYVYRYFIQQWCSITPSGRFLMS